MTQARCEARDNENMGNADPNESARSEFTFKIHGKEGERNRGEFTS
jgi:hypothetical protein